MATEVQSADISTAKAREAQKQFEQDKAKTEADKKKTEQAVKRKKALQQAQEAARLASRKSPALTGGISAVVAAQMGSLQGKLVTQVEGQVLSLLNKFSNECPNSTELEKIIKIRSTLLSHLTSFEKRVEKFSSIATQITDTVRILQTIIKLITSIPLPTAIIPPTTGGIGIPISILTKYSNALVKLNKTLDTFLGEAKAIAGIISIIPPITTNLRDELNSIDLAIQQCSLGQPADLNQILATAQPPSNTGSEGTPTDAQGNPDPNYQYKGYILAIIQDPDSPKIAPRRYAIAKDRAGIMKLRGESSFSSDTQVLLDELKFKIDNQFT